MASTSHQQKPFSIFVSLVPFQIEIHLTHFWTIFCKPETIPGAQIKHVLRLEVMSNSVPNSSPIGEEKKKGSHCLI